MPSDLQVTNIKANDGTAGLVIADSTGQVTGTLGSATVFPSGKILNVEQNQFTATSSTASNDYESTATADNITISQNNSQILISVYSGMAHPDSDQINPTIQRAISGGATTADLTGGYSDGMARIKGNFWQPVYFEWLDSPMQSKDTVITYTVRFKNSNDSTTVYFAHSNTYSRIRLTEIAV